MVRQPVVPARDRLPLPDLRGGAGKEVDGRGTGPPNPGGASDRDGKGAKAGKEATEAAGISRLLVGPRGAEVKVDVAADKNRRAGRSSRPSEVLQDGGAVAGGEISDHTAKAGGRSPSGGATVSRTTASSPHPSANTL